MKLIFADNTFTGIYTENTGNRVDFKKLKEELDPDYSPKFFFQKNDTIGWPTYNHLVKTIEDLGWEVYRPVGQSISKLSYTPVMEMSKLIAEVMAEAEKTLEHKEEVEFIFCINSLSYAPFIKTLKRRYPYISLTLVCDLETVNDDLEKQFDCVRDMYALDIAYTDVEEAV